MNIKTKLTSGAAGFAIIVGGWTALGLMSTGASDPAATPAIIEPAPSAAPTVEPLPDPDPSTTASTPAEPITTAPPVVPESAEQEPAPAEELPEVVEPVVPEPVETAPAPAETAAPIVPTPETSDDPDQAYEDDLEWCEKPDLGEAYAGISFCQQAAEAFRLYAARLPGRYGAERIRQSFEATYYSTESKETAPADLLQIPSERDPELVHTFLVPVK